MGSDSDTEGNLIARIAIEQILERNENGNLSPLTSLEIQVLTDLHELVSEEEDLQEEDQKDKKKQPAKPDPNQKKSEFKKLDTNDLTG